MGDRSPRSASSSTCPGFQGSRPVRIGNDARDQLQFDTAGALLDAAYLYERFGGRLPLRTWALLKQVLQTTARRWREPDHGIWEPRLEMRHNVHSKLMCWLAFHRGAASGPALRRARASGGVCQGGGAHPQRHPPQRRGPLGQALRGLLWRQRAGCLAAAAPASRGASGRREPLVQGTIDWLRAELGDGPVPPPLPDGRWSGGAARGLPPVRLLARRGAGPVRPAGGGREGLHVRTRRRPTTSGCSPRRSIRSRASSWATSPRPSATWG